MVRPVLIEPAFRLLHLDQESAIITSIINVYLTYRTILTRTEFAVVVDVVGGLVTDDGTEVQREN